MEGKKKYKSVSLEREVHIYLPPKYYSLFIGYKAVNEMKKSESANHMIRHFFDSMPQQDRERYLRASKNSY